MNILHELMAAIGVPEEPVREVVIGAHWTAVASRNCGLASTLPEPHPHTGPSVKDAGTLITKTTHQLMELAFSPSLTEASVGLAAVNSVVDIDMHRCAKANAFEILAAQGADKDVAIVGHFPFVPQLKGVARNLWVLEQHPREGDLAAEEASSILPRCQVVGITGTSLLNHTLDGLLQLCVDAFVMLIGPTTPLTPLLFDYGIDALSGSKVVDEEKVLRHVKEGCTFRQLHRAGITLLTMTK